jgi:hypothetical protein
MRVDGYGRWDVGECIVNETIDQTGFSNPRVSDHHDPNMLNHTLRHENEFQILQTTTLASKICGANVFLSLKSGTKTKIKMYLLRTFCWPEWYSN